jgi:hypothetical protein
MDVPVGWLVTQLASADCEAPGAGVLAQDANGWSALAYVVAGACVLVGVGRGRLRAVATVMAVALVAQGVGSVLYHSAIASGSSQRLHDAALLALGGYVAGWHVGAAAATAGLGADDDAPASRRAVAGAVLGAVAGVVLHLIAPSATTAVAAA